MESGILKFNDDCTVYVEIDTSDNSVVKAVVIDSTGTETPIQYEPEVA